MAVIAVLTASIDPTVKGAILTFIAPAIDGCGMSCPDCFISQRSEQTQPAQLSPADFAKFIRDTASVRQVAAVTLQGFEPLAPSALPWTEAVLAAGHEIGAETGLVTNGLFLTESVSLLRNLNCGGVTISIDADNEIEHDRLRRRPGAWRKAMKGIEHSRAHLSRSVLVVHSVLMPGRKDRLSGLPRILAAAGVRKWAVSPLIHFRPDGTASTHGRAFEIRNRLAELSKIAAENDIDFYADDEFSLLSEVFAEADPGAEILPSLIVRTLSRPDGLLRLTPDGKCAFGLQILRAIDDRISVWGPDMDVGTFLNGRLPAQAAN